MILHGIDYLNEQLVQQGYFFKALARKGEVAFFSGLIQHRDMKIGGLSYEDDYLGNALACVIKPGEIEVRYHQDYSDAVVLEIFRDLLGQAVGSGLAGFRVSYQGRMLL